MSQAPHSVFVAFPFFLAILLGPLAAQAHPTAIRYQIHLEIDANRKTFSGKTTIQFQVHSSDQPVSIDFRKATVQSIVVNGQKMEVRSVYNQRRILLPPSALRRDDNQVQVVYQQTYSNDGVGIYRYRDADGLTYIATQLQPHEASTVFPCFDSPQYKAMMTLSVTAPPQWQVGTNEPLRMQSQVLPEGISGKQTWHFQTTSRPLATYLFALRAGPFFKLSDSTHHGVSYSLSAPRSISPKVPHQEWTSLTQAIRVAYESIFDFKFPYRQYHQWLLPGFVGHAMEEAGAPGFSTSLVLGRTRQDEIERRDTLAHELAHMWFGDLVTPKTWKDLWLNEAFASWIALHVLTSTIGSPEDQIDTAVYQAIAYRDWAYQEDLLPTTHPVMATIGTGKNAETLFSGITYGKGMAALEILSRRVGPTVFQQVVRDHIRRHADGNADSRDFFTAFSQAIDPQVVQEWKSDWLESRGMNALRVVREGPRTWKIHQEKDQVDGRLRHHRFLTLIYQAKTNGSLVRLDRRQSILRPGTSLKLSLKADDESILILPNAGGETYARTIFSSEDLDFLSKHLFKIPDPISRAHIWVSLALMVREAELSAERFLSLATQQLLNETHPILIKKILGDLDQASEYLTPQARENHFFKLRKFCRSQMQSASSPEVVRLYLTQLLNLPLLKKDRDHLHRWLTQNQHPRLPLDQELRWLMIRGLSGNGDSRANTWIQSERRRDVTASGRANAVAAEVSFPNVENKQKWLSRITGQLDPGKYSTDELLAAIHHFQPAGQEQFTEMLKTDFFTILGLASTRYSDSFIATLTDDLFPRHCEASLVARTDEALNAYSSNPTIIKELQNRKQRLLNRLKAQRTQWSSGRPARR